VTLDMFTLSNVRVLETMMVSVDLVESLDMVNESKKWRKTEDEEEEEKRRIRRR